MANYVIIGEKQDLFSVRFEIRDKKHLSEIKDLSGESFIIWLEQNGYEVRVMEKGIKYKAVTMELPKLPNLPEESFYSKKYLEALEKRLKNWDKIIKFGCKCEVFLKSGNIISETVWVRNIDRIDVPGLCENIAKLIAF